MNLLKTQSHSIDFELSDTHEVLEYFSDDGSEPGDIVYDYVEDLEPGDDINEIISFNHSAFNNQSLDSILGNIPYERAADTPESYISGNIYNEGRILIMSSLFVITVHHLICGFFISSKFVQKSGLVHKSSESPQIESVENFTHTMFILCYAMYKKGF